MTTASFYKKNGNFYKFCISGHSGYAEEGSDIVCAAVSSMTNLTINNITDSFGIPALVSVDDKSAEIILEVNSDNEIAFALLNGFFNELKALETDYPKFVRVIQK